MKSPAGHDRPPAPWRARWASRPCPPTRPSSGAGTRCAAPSAWRDYSSWRAISSPRFPSLRDPVVPSLERGGLTLYCFNCHRNPEPLTAPIVPDGRFSPRKIEVCAATFSAPGHRRRAAASPPAVFFLPAASWRSSSHPAFFAWGPGPTAHILGSSSPAPSASMIAIGDLHRPWPPYPLCCRASAPDSPALPRTVPSAGRGHTPDWRNRRQKPLRRVWPADNPIPGPIGPRQSGRAQRRKEPGRPSGTLAEVKTWTAGYDTSRIVAGPA